METRRIPLRFAERARTAVVREPLGSDELAVGDVSTHAAIGLVDRLLVDEGPGCLTPGQTVDLTASDRDQVLAALHGLCFGDRVAATLVCGGCGAPFDYHFDVCVLANHVAGEARPDAALRLPTGADELAVATLAPPAAALALARRSLGADAGEAEAETLGERLAAAAPVISLDLQAQCPECHRANSAPFDIQGYFLGRLLGSRAALVRETHRLASAYGWSATEILGLRRSLRRAFVAQVEADRSPRRFATRLGA